MGQRVFSPAPLAVWASALSSGSPSAAPAVPWGHGTKGSAISLEVASVPAVFALTCGDVPPPESSRAGKTQKDPGPKAEGSPCSQLGAPIQSPRPVFHSNRPSSAQGLL